MAAASARQRTTVAAMLNVLCERVCTSRSMRSEAICGGAVACVDAAVRRLSPLVVIDERSCCVAQIKLANRQRLISDLQIVQKITL